LNVTRIRKECWRSGKIETDAAGTSNITICGRCAFNADRQGRSADQTSKRVRLRYLNSGDSLETADRLNPEDFI
jgi:hypothetical protein